MLVNLKIETIKEESSDVVVKTVEHKDGILELKLERSWHIICTFWKFLDHQTWKRRKQFLHVSHWFFEFLLEEPSSSHTKLRIIMTTTSSLISYRKNFNMLHAFEYFMTLSLVQIRTYFNNVVVFHFFFKARGWPLYQLNVCSIVSRDNCLRELLDIKLKIQKLLDT